MYRKQRQRTSKAAVVIDQISKHKQIDLFDIRGKEAENMVQSLLSISGDGQVLDSSRLLTLPEALLMDVFIFLGPSHTLIVGAVNKS